MLTRNKVWSWKPIIGVILSRTCLLTLTEKKKAIQNEVETEELLADNKAACGSGSYSVTDCSLPAFHTSSELAPFSLQLFNLQDDFLYLPKTLFFSFCCINKTGNFGYLRKGLEPKGLSLHTSIWIHIVLLLLFLQPKHTVGFKV